MNKKFLLTVTGILVMFFNLQKAQAKFYVCTFPSGTQFFASTKFNYLTRYSNLDDLSETYPNVIVSEAKSKKAVTFAYIDKGDSEFPEKVLFINLEKKGEVSEDEPTFEFEATWNNEFGGCDSE